MTDKIENLLKENNLIYYKRELNTGAIFIVPYRLVKFGVKLHIKIIIDNEMDQNWLFVYEILGHGSLKDDWAPMKKAKVSFLKDAYR